MDNTTTKAIEDEIAGLFQQYLGLPDTFDRAASFIQLGGKSSTGMQLQIDLKKKYGMVVTYAEMRKFNSAEGLARLVAQHLDEKDS